MMKSSIKAEAMAILSHIDSMVHDGMIAYGHAIGIVTAIEQPIMEVCNAVARRAIAYHKARSRLQAIRKAVDILAEQLPQMN